MLKSKTIVQLYYLIVCSRGPGTETTIVKKVKLGKHGIGQKEVNDTEKRLEKVPVTDIDADVDEGPVIALRKDATLADIYKWLVKWEEDNNENLNKVQDKLEKALGIKTPHYQCSQAFLSACLRAFITVGRWTSSNSFRYLYHELMTEEEFEQFVEATGKDKELLKSYDCAVLQQALSTYLLEEVLIRKGW